MVSTITAKSLLLILQVVLAECSDSILDIINTKEVEKLIAQRRKAEELSAKRFLLENELDENFSPNEYDYEYERFKPLEGQAELLHRNNEKSPRVDVGLLLRRQNVTDPYKTIDLIADLRGFKGRKVLKSSKKALLVTKMEYLQRDWCKTEPLIQKIKEQGCLPRTVINKFCYGQCNSFYIPKNPKRLKKRRYYEETEDEDLIGPAFKSCSFCKPKKYTWVTVTLKCPNSTPMFRRKRIQRIKQCKCIATNVN